MIVRRSYKTVSVAPTAEGFGIRFDESPLRTPAGAPLHLPTVVLAEAIAEEWRAHDKTIDFLAMPLFRLAATAVDRVLTAREAVVERLAACGETDLLCYRAATPAELSARQAAAYQPVLDWLDERFGIVLAVTAELQGLAHSASTLAALRVAIAGRDAFALTALQALTVDLGSLGLALAVADGLVSAEAAFAISVTEETYQNERWGVDAAVHARRNKLLKDVAAAAHFLALIAPAAGVAEGFLDASSNPPPLASAGY